MILEIDQIKAQCRIDPEFTHEDELLKLYADAAEKRVASYLNRNIYEAEVPETDPDGLIVSSDIKLAMLALISHWYENRSSVSDYEQSEVPMSFYFLVGSYRFSP
ncbi:TPA: phage gp6-like head-tail connector protein [Yersinia enterocolitica]|uniref:head-tail connector protein n=1 Tax=Yersinia enterocolitica TaxID=630 RepID=UPI0020C34E08|nr:head-tail connector protein [Yersinia enterocolitica]HDL6854409.1 phage gp6-like head-tail connector protein [Yersinia enterocolitica]HDL6858221.1 phage gp6-like head-tail connector protein [Yersinia enterocolitica]HDL6862547.1 phage gp6-like head-tail connector protein [Yersinia enterocolitica]HDL6866702.1 phage gp6-like head-tail connector protein [Yersinia enterocolitica]HDL6870456.1 phage gp6-like head-tail connector protein [Yersinia enterocolitica]